MEPSKPRDFNDLDYWQTFFKARKGNAFEWYGDFSDFAPLLARECGLDVSASRLSSSISGNRSLSILVPGCGNSELSSSLYDAGFENIINIDFSKDVIVEMMKKHLRLRPRMKWRVMDMTAMQFPDASFDIVIDKGGLDALLGDPGQEQIQATRFLSEVQRILVQKGKYICITLAQCHVIELLLTILRHGWSVNIHRVPQSSTTPGFKLKPFLVVATRDTSTSYSLVSMSFDPAKDFADYEEQMPSLQTVVQKENLIRKLIIDANADEAALATSFDAVVPGRRVIKILIGKNVSSSSYSAVVLDAPEDYKNFQYKCAVFLVPKGRRHEWLFSSTEGQWQVVESAKTNRLIMVFLDTDFFSGSMEIIQSDLSPLVQDLLPLDCKAGVSVPYLMCSDGVLKRAILEEVESSLTGPILVENISLADEDTEGQCKYYRRLAFRRNPNMIQSEALLIKVPSKTYEMIKAGSNKNKSIKNTINNTDELSGEDFRIDHSFLASPYHAVMIAGLSLIASNLESQISEHQPVRVVIIGLGAGLLPMFLHKHMPFQKIEVMELDPVVGGLAKRHFGFIEDERMKLYIGDGLTVVNRRSQKTNGISQLLTHDQIEDMDTPIHVIIIDADSDDQSSGMSCPPAAFLEESFLYATRDRLDEGGMLVVNIVARAKAPHITVPQKLLKVFAEVYSLEVEDDVNRVLFALPHSSGIDDKDDILRLASKLKELATSFAPWDNGPNIHELAERLKRCSIPML